MDYVGHASFLMVFVLTLHLWWGLDLAPFYTTLALWQRFTLLTISLFAVMLGAAGFTANTISIINWFMNKHTEV